MSLHRTDHDDEEPARDDNESRAAEGGAFAPRPRHDDANDEVMVTYAARFRPPYRPLESEFDVEARIGEGAFGVVYRAIERSTGRLVAVKRLHPRRRDGALERLQLELSAIVKLRHPHIVQLYRAARDDHGLYLVFEWAEGGSLADRLAAGTRFTEHEVLALAEKLGSALAYAHDPRHGVVHCDIKPANILLTDSGEPMLADFGLAISPSDAHRTSHSGGTMLYAAPEQWLRIGSEAAAIDGRADLYALGKTLYHLATGKPPASVILDRDLPRSLRRLVGRCVENDPDDRFRDAREFLSEVRRARGSSVVAGVRREARRLSTPRARRALAYAGIAAVATIGTFAFLPRPSEPLPAASAKTAAPGAKFVLAERRTGVEVAAETGSDLVVVARGGGLLRLRLDGDLGTLSPRDIRVRGPATSTPLRVGADFAVSIVVPASPGEYRYEATSSWDEATVFARVIARVEGDARDAAK